MNTVTNEMKKKSAKENKKRKFEKKKEREGLCEKGEKKSS